MKFGFQSSKYDNLTLEREIQFADNNKVDFFDVFFDDFVPADIVNVQLPEIFTVHLPLGFATRTKEYQKPYFDFINKNKPATVTVHFAELTMDSLEYICSQINSGIICIENSIPDRNEFSGLSYIDFMVEANAFALEKGIKIASTFDCGHTKLCGYDAVEYAKQILEKGIDVYTIHLHDNDGTGDQHRPAGSLYNGINFGEIINIFNKMNHDVYGVIEHWNNNYNALEYLRNLQN